MQSSQSVSDLTPLRHSILPDRKLIYLAEFAQFIIDHHLDEFLLNAVQSLRKLKIPLLQHMTEEEGNAVATRSTLEMLTHLIDKDPHQHIQKAISRWTSDQLPKVERNQIVVEDITLIAYSRKLMFLQFLPRFTSDAEETIRIVTDIEHYILQYTSTTFHTFIEIVDDRIQNHILQLENSQHLFNQAQSLTHIGNYVLDLQSGQIQWSAELYRIYELEPTSKSIDYNEVGAFNHPDDVERVIVIMEEARSRMDNFDFHYRIITKSGKLKTLHARGEVLPDERGNPVKIFGTCQDVTVQKEIEQKMLEHQVFIQKIADAIPAIIASYNIFTGQYTFLSGGLKKLLGYEARQGLEEGIGFFMDLIHPDDIPNLMQKNSEAIALANQAVPHQEEEIIEFQYRMRHKNGEYRWFHTYGTVFHRNKNNKVEQLINISLDITESIKAEQILLQKTHELEQSNASLEEFAFVASHDLKEPLRKISTFVDLLLSLKVNRTEKEEKYCQKILNSTHRMQQMIDNLLSLSLVTSTKEPEPNDLNSLLTDVLNTFEHQLEISQAQINSDVLPEAMVVGSQFKQLFQNLIGNSLKFARPGIPPEIEIRYQWLKQEQVSNINLKRAKKYLELIFTDNGIGFEEIFSEKIFAIFQRLHQKEVYEGTGIGLAICKRIVNNHGGSIKATGVPDQGARFSIIIPQ